MDPKDIEEVARALFESETDEANWHRTPNAVKANYRTLAARVIARVDDFRESKSLLTCTTRELAARIRDQLHILAGAMAYLLASPIDDLLLNF